MKKFLSLVLALVMTMSLVTISAGAKDFTDDSKIQYKEAIDVASTISIVDGYADGSFNPSATLTRGAAAKIICNLLLGPTTASALVADAAPYSDVPANSTFAGYIAYCQKEGIISGYADGTFRPGNTLTGYAFMKMLLGALGYDADIEGYTGANWSINVAKQALNIGLDGGLKEDFNGTKPVTREEACLYAFNTLKADLVEYPNKTTIEIGGTTVNLGAGTAKAVQWTTSAAADGNIDKKGGDNYIQFAEQYFNKLVRTGGGDDFDRPSDTWYYKGVKIGTYANTAKLTYTKSVDGGTIFADLGMVTKDDAAEVYLNGVYQGRLKVAKGNEDKLSDMNDKIGNGTIVEVYLDGNSNQVTICAQSVYAGEVTKVKAATSTKDAYVVVDYKTSTAGNAAPVSFSTNNTFETEAFEVDDIVAFTYSDDAKCIVDMYTMESVSGTLSKVVSTKSIDLGDTTYKFAEEYASETLNVKADYDVFVDENGYALYIKESDTSVENYALVLGINSVTDDAWVGNRAKLLFTDGTTKTVDLAKDYKIDSGIAADDIVSFKVEDDGDYKLTKSATQDKDTDGDVTINNKVLTADDLAVAATDNKTVFVVEKTIGNEYTTCTGIKNAPKVTGAKAYALENNDGNMLRVVFLLDGTVTAANTDIVFVAGKSVSKVTTDIDGNQFYTYNAVVKGEVSTIMVKRGQSFTDASYNVLSNGEKVNKLMNDFDTDDGIVVQIRSFDTDGGDVLPMSLTGIRKYSDDEVKLASSVYSVAKNANIFITDVDGDIVEAEFSDITTDSNDIAYFTLEEGEITNLFIVEVKG